MIAVNVTWHNAGPHTVWGRLAAKLGREPTNEEAKAEVLRILGKSDDTAAAVVAKGRKKP